MLTINDMRDAAQSGAVDAMGWAQEWLGGFLQPLIEMEQARTVESVIAMWKQMPAEMHARMQAANPEEHAKMEKTVAELEKRGGTNA